MDWDNVYIDGFRYVAYVLMDDEKALLVAALKKHLPKLEKKVKQIQMNPKNNENVIWQRKEQDGMTRCGLSRCLSTGSISVKTLEKIAEAFNVSVLYFFNDQTNNNRLAKKIADFLYAHDLNQKLEDLDLSLRTYNALKAAGINTYGDILKNGPRKLTQLPNFGKKSMEEIVDLIFTNSGKI